MQQYYNLQECIKMCDRILVNNYEYSNGGFVPFVKRPEIIPTYFQIPDFPVFSKPAETADLQSVGIFYPSQTIVVNNFKPEAKEQLRNFVSMFGIVEVFDIVKEDGLPHLAIVQYSSKAEAAEAILSIPGCRIRRCHLSAVPLWGGPYEQVDSSGNHAKSTCSQKRVVYIGHLHRNVTVEVVYRKCEKYGKIEDIKIQIQDQRAVAYVAFVSPLSAAVATFCLFNSAGTDAALLFGYKVQPIVLRPGPRRQFDQNSIPLSEFDVSMLYTRLVEFTSTKRLFLDEDRKMPLNYCFLPGVEAEYLVRIPTCQVKGVSLFLELLLFDRSFLQIVDQITDVAYQHCNHKYLFRFSMDFTLHKPIICQEDALKRATNPVNRWSSLFVLDLQICFPCGYGDPPRLDPFIQEVNHFHSDLGLKIADESNCPGFLYGKPVLYVTSNLSATINGGDDTQHRNKIKFLITENLPYVRLAGSFEDLNSYRLPVHVMAEVLPNGKHFERVTMG